MRALQPSGRAVGTEGMVTRQENQRWTNYGRAPRRNSEASGFNSRSRSTGIQVRVVFEEDQLHTPTGCAVGKPVVRAASILAVDLVVEANVCVQAWICGLAGYERTKNRVGKRRLA